MKLEGKGAARLTDKMFHNAENAANLAGAINGGAGGGDDDEDDKDSEYEDEYQERPKRREQRGSVSRNNTVQNAEFRAAIQEAERRMGTEITKDMAQAAHQAITGQAIGGAGQFEELVVAIMEASRLRSGRYVDHRR